MLAKLLLGVQPNNKVYVEDVFSSDIFIGLGTATTVINGIDLAGRGGMVWTKSRTGSSSNYINTTNSAAQTYVLRTESTGAEGNESSSVSSFNSNGFTGWAGWNGHGMVSWTFRKAPKFFDTVRWTGNAVAGRQISHSLGVVPGMILVKSTSNGSMNWCVWHNSMGGVPAGNGWLYFNTTAAASANNGEDRWGTGPGGSYIGPTSTNFTVASDTQVNGNGDTYVAYLFAHDPSVDGMIQCGSFTTDGSGYATVNLGWEPQFLLFKSSSGIDDWVTVDTARGWSATASTNGVLRPNTSGAESAGSASGGVITATGFVCVRNASTSYVYMAIRRPTKTPTDATKVFSLSSVTNGTQSPAVNYPDLVLNWATTSTQGWQLADRLRGFLTGYGSNTVGALTNNPYLVTNSTATESTTGCRIGGLSVARSIGIQGSHVPIEPGVIADGGRSITYWFKRAAGFVDVVCYTGTGANATLTHNLGVIPELVIYKGRSNSFNWLVYNATIGVGNYLALNSTAASAASLSTYWNSTAPTASSLSVGSHISVNQSGQTFVAYLFATCAGVSKVGSWVANGSGSQVIDCGFSTGARFVLFKDITGSAPWYIFDTTRGIVSGNDPYMRLNLDTVEDAAGAVDGIDPHASGFIDAGSITASGRTYIFLAIA